MADRRKAKLSGFSETGHAVKGNLVCLNEKEVMNNPVMRGTLQERAKALGGSVCTATKAKMMLN